MTKQLTYDASLDDAIKVHNDCRIEARKSNSTIELYDIEDDDFILIATYNHRGQARILDEEFRYDINHCAEATNFLAQAKVAAEISEPRLEALSAERLDELMVAQDFDARS